MSNPYAPPQAGPPVPEPDAFADDPAIRRWRRARYVCAIVIGFVVVPIGTVSLVATFTNETFSGRLAAGIVGAALLLVGVYGLRGRAWPLYATAVLATLWLGYFAISTPWAMENDRYFGRSAILIMGAILALPGLAMFLVATLGVWFDLRLRERRAFLARQSENPAVRR